MLSRKDCARIAGETLAILERGSYVAPAGHVAELRVSVAAAVAGTVHYAPHDFPEVYRKRDERIATQPRHATTFRVVNASSLAAARDLWRERGADVFCLNFASARHPGGGFLSGARAQEESLARSSALYPCINPVRAMYDANRACGTCLYTDHMIYSPRVPVLRDDNGNLLDEPYPVSFLTAPAVNVGALKPHERPHVEPAMRRRMEHLLSVAALHGHDTLVLGAWGCGVFKNDPAQVADWFHDHLTGHPAFRGAFREVIFAVLDWSDDRHFIGPFERGFGAAGG